MRSSRVFCLSSPPASYWLRSSTAYCIISTWRAKGRIDANRQGVGISLCYPRAPWAAMHPFRRDQRELQLQRCSAFMVPPTFPYGSSSCSGDELVAVAPAPHAPGGGRREVHHAHEG